MDILQKAAIEFDYLCKRQYVFKLSNGQIVRLVFKPQNFAHLAGIRKFSDLYEFSKATSSINLFNKIIRGELSLLNAQQSENYGTDARERIENLSRIGELLYTKSVVYGFDAAKSIIKSRLRSTVILFKDDGHFFYLILGIAPDGATYYPETFFLRYDDAYIKGQNIVTVESFSEE